MNKSPDFNLPHEEAENPQAETPQTDNTLKAPAEENAVEETSSEAEGPIEAQAPSEAEAPLEETRAESCERCNEDLRESSGKFCPKCGFPANGTEQDQKNFYHALKLKQDVLDDAQKKLKRVSVMLYILAGINILYGLYFFGAGAALYGDDAGIIGATTIIMGLIFIGCALWVKKNPVAGTVTAFSIYALVQVASALVEPTTLFQGIILKIIIVVIFVRGIRSAFDYREYLRKLDEHAV